MCECLLLQGHQEWKDKQLSSAVTLTQQHSSRALCLPALFTLHFSLKALLAQIYLKVKL